jgi:hypothetical protein
MKTFTIEEAKELFPNVNFNLPENFIRIFQKSELADISKNFVDTDVNILIFSNKLGEAFFYEGLEAEEIDDKFDKFSDAVKYSRRWKKSENRGYIEYFLNYEKTIRALNLLEIKSSRNKIGHILSVSLGCARKLIFDTWENISKKIDKELINVTYESFPYEFRNIWSMNGLNALIVTSRYGEKRGFVSFGDNMVIVNKNIDLLAKIKRTKLEEESKFKTLDYPIFLLLTSKSPEEKMQVSSPEYKKIKKILESNKTPEEKYFLIKCFLAS